MNSLGLGVRLLAGVSVMAIGLSAGPALAQDSAQAAENTKPESASTSTDTKNAKAQTIVVTGVRAALQSARARKKNADTVMDSITATDIGAFPDKSVAEALQRVPGITVSRFAINTDTAHFTTEPSGVLVRGLPQVRSEFNGRDTFSANGGRALSWDDVPVELLGGVDIYKNQTADLIEGGIAGSVNLRTRVPFDTNGQVLEVGAKLNYGDIGKEVTPDANVYYSNNWQTGIGKIGIMGDYAYSEVKTGSEGLQSYRAGLYDGGIIPGSANVMGGGFAKGTVAIPSGLNYLDDRFDRRRTGISAAAQWQSNDHKWLATAQYIRSVYNNTMEEHGIGVGLPGPPFGADSTYRTNPSNACLPNVEINDCGNGVPMPAGSAGFTAVVTGYDNNGNPIYGAVPLAATSAPDFTFDDGVLTHGTFESSGLWWGGGDGTALNSNGQAMLHQCMAYLSWNTVGGPSADPTNPKAPNIADSTYCPGGLNEHGAGFGTNSRIQQNHDMTQEAAFNLKWDPSSALHFNFDGQYVDSKTTFYDAGDSFSSYANPTLTFGDTPRIDALNPPTNIFLSPGGYANPDNYAIGAIADQVQDNRGHELALRADGQWDAPSGSWIDTLKFGARYADREELIQGSAYDWNNIANNWSGGCQYIYYNLDRGPGTCTDPSNGNTTTFKGYPAGYYAIEKFGEPFFGGTIGGTNGMFPFTPFQFLLAHGLSQFASENLGAVTDSTGKVVGTIGTGYEPACGRHGAPYENGGQAVDLPNSCFAANEISNISEKTKAAYLEVKFGGNDNIHIGGVKVSGNLGVRYVETEDKSDGFIIYPTVLQGQNPSQVCPTPALVPGGLTGTGTGTSAGSGGLAYPAICFLTADDVKFSSGSGTSTPLTSDVTHRNLLPSFNLRFDFSPEWLLRFAASKAMSRPDIGLLKNYMSISETLPTSAKDPGVITDSTGKIIGVTPQYTATATNPKLKPETAWQFDASLEHYFGNTGMFSFDLFYKSFQNYIQSGVFNASVTNNGVTRVVRVTGPANGKGAKIYGLEVAYNRFFDFLPRPLDGFGIQTNFTYLKNKSVPNSNLTTFFPVAGGVSNTNATALNPGSLEGLSKYSFNVVGLYERPNFPLSFRLAYNWRSRYLITAQDCCVGGPVWNAAAGYLDGSIRYSVNKHFEISLDGSNLLNTKTQTLAQVTDNTSPEKKMILLPNSQFRQDTRYTLGFRFKM